MSLYNEKVKASIFLLSYFDTLGFKNGEWEFNYNIDIKNIDTGILATAEIINQFFTLGGFSDIDLSDWNCSDDTIMAISTGIACLKGGSEKDYIDEYIKILGKLKETGKRGSGINTLNTLEKIKRLKKIDKLEYDEAAGGNGAAMRTSLIGLIYYKEEDLDKLISNSITASRVTHNYSLGFLGGLVTALFTSYAIRNIPIWNWVDNLLEIYESKIIDKYMQETNIYNEYKKDKDFFFDNWYEYREQILIDFKNYGKLEQTFNSRIRSLLNYNQLFNNRYSSFGGSGISVLIVAYDALLMSYGGNKLPINLESKDLKFSVESLMFFSALHFGDNDTTGAVAGAWYGAFFGFKKFDQEKINQLELKNELENITQKVIDYNKESK